MMRKDILHSLETLSVLKVLCQGIEKTFSELKRASGLAGATLALRLKVLEREGYVERNVVKSWPPKTAYRITERGRELYSQLIEEKLKPEIEEYVEKFPDEVYSLVRRYLKLEP
jgi:DNA-binding HxlR family transcriptional regulator